MPLRKRVRNRMKLLDLQGCNKKERTYGFDGQGWLRATKYQRATQINLKTKELRKVQLRRC